MTSPPPSAPRRPALLARFSVRMPPRSSVSRGRPGPWVLLAAWGPCGYAPVAPGTFGTLGAIPLCWALGRISWPAYALATLALAAVAVYAAHRAGRYWGVVDASPIVIDEVVGYLLAMAFVPFTWPAAIAAFLLFRVFDVIKPWPASAFDRIKSGFGVVMDDVCAGVFAWGTLQLLLLALRSLAGCGGELHWWCLPVAS